MATDDKFTLVSISWINAYQVVSKDIFPPTEQGSKKSTFYYPLMCL